MSRIDENGIRYHTFYETDESLGLPERSEEEMIEYKRLIGMPLTDDYDELIASLIPFPSDRKSILSDKGKVKSLRK